MRPGIAKVGASPWVEPPGVKDWARLTRQERVECLELVRARPTDPLGGLLQAALAEAGFAPWGATYISDCHAHAFGFLCWAACHQAWGMLGTRPLTLAYLRACARPGEQLELVMRSLGCRRPPRRPVDVERMRRFLAEEIRRPRWVRHAPGLSEDARELLRVVRVAGGRVPLNDLHLLLPCWEPVRIRAARNSLASRLLVFFDLDPLDLLVEIGLMACHRADRP